MTNHHNNRKKLRRLAAKNRLIENKPIKTKVLNNLLEIKDVRYYVINLRGVF